MTASTAFPAWTACTSALRLDRWLAGELLPEDGRELLHHLAACPRCAAAADALRAARGETLPPLRPSGHGAPVAARAQRGLAASPGGAAAAPAPGRGPIALRRRPRAWGLPALAGAAAALAAGLVVSLRAGPDPGAATALKGAGFGVSMYVQHAGAVRRVAEGEAVAPGDAIRFAVSTPVRRYVGILSLDPRRRASIYFPAGARAEAVAPGVDAPLPAGTRLDDSVGEERIWTLFCAAPLELEPVRAELERTGELGDVPEGCEVSAWRFVKR